MLAASDGMAYRSRDLVAGGVYHVWARGARRGRIFESDEDRRQYLLLWGQSAIELGWRCMAYCLMDNHVHHLVETPKPNLSTGVRWAHRDYARYFNARRDAPGHLFETRYGSHRAENPEALRYFACYVALNPVRAGICARPEEYAWSSHAATIDRTSAQAPRWLASDRLLAHFEHHAGSRVERYADLVDAVHVLGLAGLDVPLTR